MSHRRSDPAWLNLMKLGRSASEDLRSQSGRVAEDISLARDFGNIVASNGVIDDRKYIIERIIQLAASLPNESTLRHDLSGGFIKTLWNNLQHPPPSMLGDTFRYRTADGSNNNLMYPQLGASGSHYARTVVGTGMRPVALPDPGMIFDVLLRREGPAKEHPTKISSFLFYFAILITHDIFRTDEVDNTKIKSSSYLDLGPLYGHDQAQQNSVRAFQDGLLKPDTFAEYRLLAQPPGVGALLVAFNRFHNYIVRELAIINEHGRFSLPANLTTDSPKYKEAQLKRDNDLFQTGRLITCGLYVNIILGDYVRTILNLNDNPTDSDWTLDPREAFSSVLDHEGTPRGLGNQVSAEFNFVYRWHSTVSNRDEEWLNKLMGDVFGRDVDYDNLSTKEFLDTLKTWFHTKVPRDPSQWVFGGLKRQQSGSFSEADLVGLLTAATDTSAGAFGARNTPVALRAIEILGIQQGRQWGLASLNEFRAFFKYKPFTTFAEINSDPEVAQALEALYGHPDNVELYPGLMAEETKQPAAPGSGLCPGFTISEAILADAVALVRGDRFYAVEFGPRSLTNFGFKEVSTDYDVAGGGVMYKLLMRAFPNWYHPNSVYALYPFTTPERTKEIFTKKGRTPHDIKLNYDWPSSTPDPTPVVSWQGVKDVLGDEDRFKVPWDTAISQLMGHGYMVTEDNVFNKRQRAAVREALYRPAGALDEIRSFFEATTESLISNNKRKLRNIYQIDIIRDIGGPASAMFAAELFGIPLRESGDGGPDAFTVRKLQSILSHVSEYVFLDTDPAKSYKLRVVASRDMQQLAAAMRRVVENVRGGYRLLNLFRKQKGSSMPGFGKALIARLLEKSKSVDEVVAALVPTQLFGAVTLGQAWAQVIDVYMLDEYQHHWADIEKLARSDGTENFEKLQKYILEGFRLFPAASGLVRATSALGAISSGPRDLLVSAKTSVCVDLFTAGLDPARFPDPTAVRLDRPAADYIQCGSASHSCLGGPIATIAVTAMVRAFARHCEGARRAPGEAGEMRRKMKNGTFPLFLAEDGASWESFPVAKKVLFDVPATGVPK
ncbi:fatty acid oxygenase [Thozetella sp. PMI_491]|nr:fatty acid oxygenase [Thozetella sp. PMI_491]